MSFTWKTEVPSYTQSSDPSDVPLVLAPLAWKKSFPSAAVRFLVLAGTPGELTDTVPAGVPFVLQSMEPPGKRQEKYRSSPSAVRYAGPGLPASGTISSIEVPSVVPLVFQTSRPLSGVLAVKYRVAPASVRLKTLVPVVPGLNSLTSWVPPGLEVPSVFHSSQPVMPLSPAK